MGFIDRSCVVISIKFSGSGRIGGDKSGGDRCGIWEDSMGGEWGGDKSGIDSISIGEIDWNAGGRTGGERCCMRGDWGA